jgi:sec-independent protein translocase protein TatA
MGTFGPVHWIVVAVLVLLLFGGRGKLSGIMGDAAKGVRAFRDGLKGDEETAKQEEPAKPLPKAKSEARAPAPRTSAPKVRAKAKTTAAKPRAKSKVNS